MIYWRTSGFYFFYFAALGALVPYWGLYLQSIGFDARQIGNLIALLMLSRIVAPNIWGWIADHRGQRMAVVRWAAFFSVVTYAGAFFGNSFWWLACVMLSFSFFWNASLPQMEAATMSHSGGSASVYARVRLWGSVGFILAVVGLGQAFDHIAIAFLLPALMFLLAGIWVFSIIIPESQMAGPRPHLAPLKQILMRPQVLAFLLACLLMQASHGPYYTFYSIYLDSYEYSKTIIGSLWALGVLCEIIVFVLLHRVRSRLGLREILIISFALATCRWLLIGFFPEHLSVLILAQVLHAATFGSYHAVAVEMVHRFFTGRHQIRGQAIYGSVSFGIGGALGSFYSGWTWDALGGTVTFALAALIAFVALLLALWRIRPVISGDDSGPAR